MTTTTTDRLDAIAAEQDTQHQQLRVLRNDLDRVLARLKALEDDPPTRAPALGEPGYYAASRASRTPAPAGDEGGYPGPYAPEDHLITHDDAGIPLFETGDDDPAGDDAAKPFGALVEHIWDVLDGDDDFGHIRRMDIHKILSLGLADPPGSRRVAGPRVRDRPPGGG